MHVQMVDGLPAVSSGINDYTITRSLQPLIPSDRGNRLHQPLHIIGFIHFMNSGDVLFRNH